MKSLLEEIHRRHTLLSRAGWFFILLVIPMAVGLLVDDRTLLGLNVWLKPIKFSISIGIFLWTMGWLIYDLRLNFRHRTLLGMGFILFMVVEMLAIVGQTLRGQPSHFNITSSFNGMVFTIMGIAIGLSTLLVAFVFFLFLKKKLVLTKVYIWGVCLGLTVFILGSLEGSFMAGSLTHTIGANDGGPGLPFLNWSTQAGDLRVAHFLALHALQLFVFVGHKLSPLEEQGRNVTPIMIFFALAYLSYTTIVFVQSMQGLPLLNV